MQSVSNVFSIRAAREKTLPIKLTNKYVSNLSPRAKHYDLIDSQAPGLSVHVHRNMQPVCGSKADIAESKSSFRFIKVLAKL